MRRRTLGISFLMGGMLLAAGCGPEPVGPGVDLAAAAAAPTAFTATDLPVGILDPGTLELLPTRIKARGLLVRARVAATDPRFSGFMVVEANANWTLTGEGPAWGGLMLETDDGGRWAGEWRGTRQITGPGQWTTTMTWEARGVDGVVTGLHATGTESLATTDVVPAFYLGQIDGWIRELP